MSESPEELTVNEVVKLIKSPVPIEFPKSTVLIPSEIEDTVLIEESIRIAQDGPKPHITDTFTEAYPDEKPLPVHGLEYTLMQALWGYFPFGLYGEKGQPQDTAIGKIDGNFVSITENRKPYKLFLSSAQDGIDSDKSNKVRVMLENLGLWGHSVRSISSDRREIAQGLYNIVRFGIWPRRSDEIYSPHPWMGTFGLTGTGTSAGDFWTGWAAVCFKNEMKPVSLPQLGAEFVSPLDLYFIVPTAEIKNALCGALLAETFIKQKVNEVWTDIFLKDRIITHDEVISGKLEKQTASQREAVL